MHSTEVDRLIKHTVEGVRTKLDHTYLEALQGSRAQSLESPEAGELKAELESLYSEILPVAQMSVEQQFLIPAQAQAASRDSQSGTKAAKAVEYVRIWKADGPDADVC